jgi:hypothetical protein
VTASPARAATFVYVGNADSGKLTKLGDYPMGQNPTGSRSSKPTWGA